MLALIFLYMLIIVVVLGIIVLILKVIGYAVLSVVLWMIFSIANLFERKKKAVRQRK